MNSQVCKAALLIAVAIGAPISMHAQTHRDVLKGSVTSDSGAVLRGADVIVTMAPDRVSQSGKTDSAGHYSITFENGTGDYLVHISAVGRTAFRKRVTRSGSDSVFAVDAKLALAGVQQLSAVNVQARKPVPQRGPDAGTGAGASERFADGVNGAVPPELAGDLAAIAGTIPGVSTIPGGVSVAGLGPSQNSTTLNGMAFGAASVPRDANTRTRVTTSTYDPARGWFGGLQEDVELSTGNIFSSRRAHLTLDAPALQYTDPVSSRLGQRFTNMQASVGGDGAMSDDKFAYNFGLQGSRRIADAVSLSDATPDILQRAGVSADSAARFFNLLSAAGIPLSASGVPSSRINQNASFIGRIDHAPYDWNTFTPARRTWGLLGYGNVSSSDAVGTGPTSTATHSGSTSQAVGSLQALFSTYFHGDYLTEASTGLTVGESHGDPYLQLPDGRVLVASTFPNGTGGINSLGFGGNGSLLTNSRQWTWETRSETQFYPAGKATHRVKLTADARLDGVRQDASTNQFGTFSYNSLADLAANRPESYTRTLNSPTRTGGEWNAFAAIGDLWRKSPTFQVMYGARIEGNRFTSAPAFNPAVESAFGARTDNTPNTLHVSPRLGFTWIRQSSDGNGLRVGTRRTPIGTFMSGPTSFIRGGIGEFRNMLSPGLLADASVATGLPNGLQSLTCVGSATPTPDWSQYLTDAGSIPNQCAGSVSSPQLADAAPAVQLFDRAYTAPRSWRANLAYASAYRRLTYTLEGVYSLNLNQPGRTDLNFSNSPRFVLGEEGRPVYVSPSSVIPATGAVSTVEARTSPLFGHVINNASNLRSTSRQATLTVSPVLDGISNWFFSLGYTLSDIRAQANGFDGSTFGSPLTREWARGDFDVRNQFLLQAGYTRSRVTLTLFGRLQSGLPFTPRVGGDVNGDGFANDRAFVFDPSRTTDASLATATRALLSTSTGGVRDCLTRQLNQPAARNSCEGPWTAALNAQVSFGVPLPRSTRRANVALAFANPLGGIDQLLHGSDNLRGWGSPAMPDQTLYNVRGFDATTNRFRYEVNPRFGSTRPANTTLRAPFRVTLDVRFDIGTSIPQQQLNRWLKPGRSGYAGPRLSAAELKKRYQRNIPDPYAGILQETDSLLLTRDQVEAVQKSQVQYRQRMDSLWTSLATYLADLGDDFNAGEALKRQEKTTDDAWDISRLDVQKALPGVLSPVQLKLLPWPASMLYTAKDPIRGIRIFVAGS